MEILRRYQNAPGHFFQEPNEPIRTWPEILNLARKPANSNPAPGPSNLNPAPGPANLNPAPGPANVNPAPGPANPNPAPGPSNLNPAPQPGNLNPALLSKDTFVPNLQSAPLQNVQANVKTSVPNNDTSLQGEAKVTAPPVRNLYKYQFKAPADQQGMNNQNQNQTVSNNDPAVSSSQSQPAPKFVSTLEAKVNAPPVRNTYKYQFKAPADQSRMNNQSQKQAMSRMTGYNVQFFLPLPFLNREKYIFFTCKSIVSKSYCIWLLNWAIIMHVQL